MEKYILQSAKETQNIAADLAARLLQGGAKKTAVVLALSGNLGAGKTTFLQGFARALGIEEVVNSPTFVILKRFKVKTERFKDFYHFDCYRLEKPEEILALGFAEIISNPENIVAIEWPEKIEALLPKEVVKISFNHVDDQTREVIIAT